MDVFAPIHSWSPRSREHGHCRVRIGLCCFLGPGHCSPPIIEEDNVIFRFAGVKPGALEIHIHMRMLSPIHMHIHNTSMTKTHAAESL